MYIERQLYSRRATTQPRAAAPSCPCPTLWSSGFTCTWAAPGRTNSGQPQHFQAHSCAILRSSSDHWDEIDGISYIFVNMKAFAVSYRSIPGKPGFLHGIVLIKNAALFDNLKLQTKIIWARKRKKRKKNNDDNFFTTEIDILNWSSFLAGLRLFLAQIIVRLK